MTTLFFTAVDGYVLQADLHRPEGRVRGAVLLAPAMGVRRRFYARFAEVLAEEGLAVLVPDYRGVGGSAPASLRGFQADLVDWAEKDLAGALEALRQAVPGVPLFWVGHSVGGQLFGLVTQTDVRAALLIGSQSGHWRHWNFPWRWGMWLLWYLFIPLSTAVRGYLPMAAVGQGEDVPLGVARQWARWGRDRRYVGLYLQERYGVERFSFPGPLQAWAVSDDAYAPVRSVEALVALYPPGNTATRVVRPEDAGVPILGHFGIFKEKGASALWRGAAAWLLSTVMGEGAPGARTSATKEA